MARSPLTAALLLAALAGPAPAADLPNPLTGSASWDALRGDIIGDRPIAPAAGRFTVEAPYRAEDAAAVPVRILGTPGAPMRTATLVIDENPAPVAAELVFGPAMAPLDFELRVRVDRYSNLRVIAGYADGLRMEGRFVKASGGCSAPAASGGAGALAALGQARLRLTGGGPGDTGAISIPRREARVTLRHPNHSGLQIDQATQLFIPAQFVDTLEIWQGDERLFAMRGGISISENPTFRFLYTDNGAPNLRILATDTNQNQFDITLPKSPR